MSNDGNGARSTSSTARSPARLRGVELALEGLAPIAFGEEQVAVEAREVAVDALLAHDGLDAVDRRGVAVGGEPRALAAVQLLDLEVAVVEHVGEVRGGRLRHAAGDRAVVEHRHLLARAGEQVGGGQAGDAGADDADVDVQVFLQG